MGRAARPRGELAQAAPRSRRPGVPDHLAMVHSGRTSLGSHGPGGDDDQVCVRRPRPAERQQGRRDDVALRRQTRAPQGPFALRHRLRRDDADRVARRDRRRRPHGALLRRRRRRDCRETLRGRQQAAVEPSQVVRRRRRLLHRLAPRDVRLLPPFPTLGLDLGSLRRPRLPLGARRRPRRVLPRARRRQPLRPRLRRHHLSPLVSAEETLLTPQHTLSPPRRPRARPSRRRPPARRSPGGRPSSRCGAGSPGRSASGDALCRS
mmetsp:Transcript_14041/g.44300  ORF Transcript_14041/g.44300 Transcript_14041/m.44300 type:complete len:264 (-) Transcript_14041:400-1191(-)